MSKSKPSPDSPSLPRPQRRAPLQWMPVFLAALAETGVVRQSVRKAGIALPTAYDARERHPEFARAWDATLDGKDPRGEQLAALCAPAPPAEPEAPGEPPAEWRELFFDALAETSNVIEAVKRAGVAPGTVYRLRREEPEFATRWLAALHEGYDNLEMELVGYLRNPPLRRKMDVANALRLLAAHRATVERRRALVEEEDEQAVLESIDRFIDDMRVRRASNGAILIEVSSGNDAQ